MSNSITLEELNEKVLSLYKKDPLSTIVPAGFSGDDSEESDFSPVKDSCNVGVSSLAPNIDDLEIIAVSVIGMIPSVGPICQSFYQIIRNRTKEKVLSKAEVEKLIEEKIKSLKIEMERMIDEKVEKSKIEQYKTLCENAFKGFAQSSLELLVEDMDILKLKLSKGIIESNEGSFLSGLRGKYDIYRDNLKALLPLFRDQKLLPYVYIQLIDIMYLYIFCMQNLINYWYQYGFDPVYARGTPKVGNTKETHSYREKLHINIQKSLKAIENAFNTNHEGLEKLYKMFECDPVLYPIPLFKAPVNPSFNKMYRVRPDNLTYSTPVVEIDVNMHARPFIYRIDGVNFIGDWSAEDVSGFAREIPNEADQITGAIGFYIRTKPQITIKLSEPKFVTIRSFTKMQSNRFNLSVKYEDFNKFDYECSSLAPRPKVFNGFKLESFEKRGSVSGFCIGEKTSSKQSELNIKITGDKNPQNYDKLLFIEVIVSDD